MDDSQDDYDDDESDNRDDINEYQDSDSDDFDDIKTVLVSKKTKQLTQFKSLMKSAFRNFQNAQYLDFQQNLKQLNDAIIQNKWQSDSFKMPKFYVKHMSIILLKLADLQEKEEKNAGERRALKSLKKNPHKQFKHTTQITLFEKKPQFWKDEESDLGADDDDDLDDDADDDDALFQLQDANAMNNDDNNDNDNNDDADGFTFGESADEDDDNDRDDNKNAAIDEDDDVWDEFTDDEDEDGVENAASQSDNASQSDADSDDSDSDEDGGEKKQTDDAQVGNSVFDQEELAKMRDRNFWVKKTKKKKPKPGKKKLIRKKVVPKVEGADDEEKKAKEEKIKKAQKEKEKAAKKKIAGKRDKWSVNKIRLIFADILANRGKTNVNREMMVKNLMELQSQCEIHKAEQARLTVISILISFFIDGAQRKTTGMSGNRWRETSILVNKLLIALTKNLKSIRMSPFADLRLVLKEDGSDKTEMDDDGQLAWMNAMRELDEGNDDATNQKDENNKDDNSKDGGGDDDGMGSTSGGNIKSGGFSVIQAKKNKVELDAKYTWIHGNLLSYIKTLTEQLFQNLKSITPKSPEYKKRLTHQSWMIKIFKKAFVYFGKLKDTNTQSAINVLWMSVIHNDYNEKLDELKRKIDLKKAKKCENDGGDDTNAKNGGKKKQKTINMSDINYRGQKVMNLPKSDLIERARFVFQHGATRQQTEAMLYVIYWMALHNYYEICRDLLLMSHLGSKERVGSTNIDLQILYNRAISKFAVSAFMQGYWLNSMLVLQELYEGGNYNQRVKLLLGQGFIRAPSSKATAEQLKVQQLQYQKMLPSHLHIPADELDSAHLISALFIEIPKIVTDDTNRGWIRNAYFRKIWNSYLRRDLRVPPESTQTLILSTGIYMMEGEWLKCKEFVKKLKLWDSIKHSKFVQKKVLSELKRQCMKCYLYRYGAVYESISVKKLADMYNLTEAQCKQYVCKIIITSRKDHKFASLDSITNCITMHSTPPNPLQRIALEYSDKLGNLTEQNEKLIGIYNRYIGGGGGSSRFKNMNKGKDGKGGKGKDGRKGRFGSRGVGGGGSRGGGSGGNSAKPKYGSGGNRRTNLTSFSKSNNFRQRK